MANAVAIPPREARPVSHRSSTGEYDGHHLRLPPMGNARLSRPALDSLSPVNQRGHFEFDRVIKSGLVQKRTRKTKSWRSVYLVLRPNVLYIYRNPDETKLRHKINLVDITAIARQKDPKGRAKHVFGIFSPSRNFHIASRDDKEAQEWVEIIRREARIDQDEEEDMNLASPGGYTDGEYTGFGRADWDRRRSETTAVSSSDAETFGPSSPMRARAPIASQGGPRRPSTIIDYSGPEYASQSDLSDTAMSTTRHSALLVPRAGGLERPTSSSRLPVSSQAEASSAASGLHHHAQHEERQARAAVAAMQEAARIVCEGHLLLLKSHSGVKQWKKTWMVLRTKSLTMYKNEKEYTALKVLPLDSIVDVVEVDPISSSKRYCMQIITEDKSFRYCAPNEDTLAKWLGAFKSLLVRRREAVGAPP